MLRYILTFFLFYGLTQVSAQTLTSKLEASFQQLSQDAQAKYGLPSMVILDANTGELIFAKNEHIGLAPASTLKTIIAATAYHILGSDYTFQTSLHTSGKITEEGILDGDIVIRGNGDPTLASDRFPGTKEHMLLQKFIEAIQAKGIKSVTGKIIGDNFDFPSQTVPEKWIWQDMGNYYGAGAAGLNWRENQFDIELQPGAKVGAPVKMGKTIPNMPYLKIYNELNTGSTGSGDNAYAFFAPYFNQGYLRGTWGLGITKKSISASIPDPAFEAAFRLYEALKNHGITVSEGYTSSETMKNNNNLPITVNQVLTQINSPTLSEMSYWYLNKSVNLYGEAFIKAMAKKAGKIPTTKNGTTEVLDFWKEKGYDTKALRILDGSGLAPETRVTTYAMAKILFDVQKSPWFNDYLKGFPTNNGMKIKSGNIAAVQGYAGYHTAKNGKKYIVVININNYNGSGIAQKLFRTLEPIK